MTLDARAELVERGMRRWLRRSVTLMRGVYW
jgi:hypothetical protein